MILPYSETVLWIAVALVCSAVSGRCSIAISWVTMELTSRPLPMPAELIVPVPDVLIEVATAIPSQRPKRTDVPLSARGAPT